jgi:hypothetical protein
MWSLTRYRIQLARLLWRQQLIMFAVRMAVLLIGVAIRTWSWLGKTVLGIHRMCLVVS